MPDRIDLDDDGTPDDVAFDDAKMVHIERMDTGHVWMAIYKQDGRRYVVNFYTPRNGRLLWRVEKDWIEATARNKKALDETGGDGRVDVSNVRVPYATIGGNGSAGNKDGGGVMG